MKLYRPRTDVGWIARPTLLARLDAGLHHKLILLTAPPGFGKSTLVSQWLDQLDAIGEDAPIQSCWLSLDEGDNQLTQFLHYIIAAIQRCEPTACPKSQRLLSAAQLPSSAYLSDLLVRELSDLTTELVLVLDDYHLIQSEEVHQVMRQLLRYRPALLHLVILSRIDPPLYLGRLRIEQQITELRSGDLRFAVAETRQFLAQQLRYTIDDHALQELHSRTEGWITALQLSSIALQRQEPAQFLRHFHGNDRLLVGYLAEEVMAHLSEAMRDFLLHTALVDRFCAPLADALLADRPPAISSQAMISEMEERNLFIIPLDQRGEWVRYHDLFRDFLCHQLRRSESPARLARLHQIASRWYADNGLIEEALHHALATGDEGAAVDLLLAQFHSMLDHQLPAPTLMRWLALFPPATIQAWPGLRFAQLWLSAFGIGPAVPMRQLSEIEAQLRADPTLPANRRNAFLADMALLRGIFAYWAGEPRRAIVLLQATLAQQSPTHLLGRAQALIHLASAYHCSGNIADGRTLLRAALAEDRAQQRPTTLILLGGLAILYLQAGELTETIQTAREAVAAVHESADHAACQAIGFVDIWSGWAHYLLGMAHYEQNDLTRAAVHWQRVAGMRYRTNPGVYHGSLLGLALLALAHGNPDEANVYAQAAHEFAAEIRRPQLLALSDAFEVRLRVLAGQTIGADHLIWTLETDASQGMAIGVELPLLTRLRAHLSLATDAARLEALAFATTCLHHAQNSHNTQQLIQLGARQALILHELGRREEAFERLAQTLALSEPGGFVRTFVDLGAPQAELLRHFEAKRGSSAYLKTLIAAFPPLPNPPGRDRLMAHYAKAHGITPLTPREIDLLLLIRRRFSINEIAAALVNSPNTVKKHTNNIYTKLGVHNRRAAVAKAEALNLLPLP